MYIGRLGNGAHAEDGIYVLLKESIDNSIDEFTMGHGKKIEIAEFKMLTQEDKVELRDLLIAEGYNVRELGEPAPA
jgi:DNA gyrase/topoisomerase IV subunit B